MKWTYNELDRHTKNQLMESWGFNVLHVPKAPLETILDEIDKSFKQEGIPDKEHHLLIISNTKDDLVTTKVYNGDTIDLTKPYGVIYIQYTESKLDGINVNVSQGDTFDLTPAKSFMNVREGAYD